MNYLKSTLWAALAAAVAFSPVQSGASDPPVKRVAVCPLTIHSPNDLSYLRGGLVDIFTSRLQVQGSLATVDKGTVRDALGDLDPSSASETVLRSLLSKVGADYLVYGSLTQLGQSVSLDVRLLGKAGGPAKSFSTRAANLDALLPQVDRLMGEVKAAILPGAPAAETGAAAQPPAPTAEAMHERVPEKGGAPLEPTLTLDLPLHARGMGVGDVTGDGRNEVVVADSTNVFVYRLEGQDLQQLAQYSGKSYEDFLHLDLADLDGNGAAEIFVTSLRGGPHSLVLGWSGGELRVLATDLPYFLRAFKTAGGPTRLIGQKSSGGDWPFDGERFELRWQNGRYVAGGALPGILPLYGYLPVDLDGNGGEETVVLDGEQRLEVLSAGGAARWRSAGTYGGGCVVCRTPPHGADDDSAGYVEIPPRMIAVPGAQGEPRVFVARNTSSGILNFVREVKHYDRGELTELAWDGKRMDRAWRYQEIRGCVADLQYGDVDNDGRADLVAVATSGGGGIPFMQGSSSVYVFQGTIP